VILQSDGEYPVLRLRPEGRDVLRGKLSVFGTRTKEKPKEAPTKRRRLPGEHPRDAAARRTGTLEGPPDADLFERLRELRLRLASEQGVPPYIVFSDRTLREMAQILPTTEAELALVTGVGSYKLTRYGGAFLDVIRTYLSERQAERGSRN
jgi:ATP-dependent DNA helicase RecQ